MGGWAIGLEGTSVRFAVHTQPRASRTEVVGLHGDALKVKVASPPVDGAANEELTRFIAKQLGVSASRVSIVSGALSRRKIIEVEGVTEEEVRSLLPDSR